MMAEPTSSGAAAGASALIKAYGIKAIAGAVAVGIGFAILWPKTAREGVSRIICTITGSMLGGKPALAAVVHWAPWYPVGTEADMLIYVAAGLPAWWLIGAVVRWFENRRSKDIGEMVDELRGKP